MAMLISAARGAALLVLTFDFLQRREEHKMIADLAGKGGGVPTVPVRM